MRAGSSLQSNRLVRRWGGPRTAGDWAPFSRPMTGQRSLRRSAPTEIPWALGALIPGPSRVIVGLLAAARLLILEIPTTISRLDASRSRLRQLHSLPNV